MELIVLGFVVAVIAAAAAIAATSRRRFRRDNEVVPGVDSGAPVEWAGAHTAEARLHRRLRDAIRALHRVPGIREQLDDVRRALEDEASAIDAQLIAVAALPERVRAAPLKKVEAATDGLEDAVAELAERRQTGDAVVAETLDDAMQRQRWLDEARAELDRLDATATQLPPTPKRVEIIDPATRRPQPAVAEAVEEERPTPPPQAVPDEVARPDDGMPGGQVQQGG